MKATKLLLRIFATIICFVGLSACSADEPAVGNGTLDNGFNVVKAPEFKAYSGNHILKPGARSADVDDVITSAGFKGEFDKEKYLAQRESVDRYLAEGLDNSDKLNMDFLYHAEEDLTFEMFYLSGWTANRPSYLGIFFYDENGELHKKRIWDWMNPRDTEVEGKDEENDEPRTLMLVEGIRVTVKAGYKFGFFWEGRSSTAQRCEWYSIAELNEPAEQLDGNGVYSTHAGTFEIDGVTFMGFEDWIDFDYQDWVFFVDPALKTVPSDDKLPDFANPPTEEDEPDVEKRHNEVEVNLALEDKGPLSSHLSLHVRHSTDVEIFIPVPDRFYCEADDMAIVENKKGDLLVHGGPFRTEYDINGNIVSLNVEFIPDGIRIWTDGINEDVIGYCQEHYGDGITFEVWNYFNETVLRDELLNLLNLATVRFLDSEPDSYINAFTDAGGRRNPDDCTVSIVDGQAGDFEDGKEGPHKNGSDFNMIYDNKKNSDDNRHPEPPVY